MRVGAGPSVGLLVLLVGHNNRLGHPRSPGAGFCPSSDFSGSWGNVITLADHTVQRAAAPCSPDPPRWYWYLQSFLKARYETDMRADESRC